MSTLELSDEQVISLVRGLPAERKRAALLALAQEAQAGREDRLRWAEAQLRRASAQRGLDWDRLSEDERESFVGRLTAREIALPLTAVFDTNILFSATGWPGRAMVFGQRR